MRIRNYRYCLFQLGTDHSSLQIAGTLYLVVWAWHLSMSLDSSLSFTPQHDRSPLCVDSTYWISLESSSPFPFFPTPPLVQISMYLCLGSFSPLTGLAGLVLLPFNLLQISMASYCPQDKFRLSRVYPSWAAAEADYHGCLGWREGSRVRSEEQTGDLGACKGIYSLSYEQ